MRSAVFFGALATLAASSALAGPQRSAGPRLIVFDIESSGLHLGGPAFERLAAYLTEKAAASGYAVVPRKELLRQLRAEREGAQRSCYDLPCQTSVGRALGAEKTLSTKILRLDDVCAVTMALHDLRGAKAVRVADATCRCELGALVRGLEEAVLKLAPSRDLVASKNPGVVDHKRCPGRGARRVGQAYPKGLSVWCVDAKGRRFGRALWWHPDGQLAEKGRYRKDRKQGRWTYYHPNGRRRLQVAYRDDQWHGQWLRWDTTGALVEVGACRFGKREGRWLHYDREGNKRREERYEGDVKQGLVVEWHANGKKSAEYLIRAGEREGSFRSWRSDGSRAEEGVLVAGKRHGKWLKYLAGGEVIEEHWRAGVREGPAARWHGGKKVQEGKYRAGERHGRWVTYDVSGERPVRVREGLYRRGKMHGRWVSSLSNGVIQSAEEFRDGRRHGHAVYYDLDGNKVSEGPYRRDKKHGRWRFYDRGALAREEVYVEGRRMETIRR